MYIEVKLKLKEANVTDENGDVEVVRWRVRELQNMTSLKGTQMTENPELQGAAVRKKTMNLNAVFHRKLRNHCSLPSCQLKTS